MQLYKKLVTAAAACVLSLCLLTACGGSASGAPSGASSAADNKQNSTTVDSADSTEDDETNSNDSTTTEDEDDESALSPAEPSDSTADDETNSNDSTTTDDEDDESALSPEEAKAYAAIMAMKTTYYEGMEWTNANKYVWEYDTKKDGITTHHIKNGYGCAAFAYILSDAAFGKVGSEGATLPREIKDFSNYKLRVGDILRYLGNTHSVVILKVDGDTLTVAEGNYNSSIHWGREISISETKSTWNYIITRYSE